MFFCFKLFLSIVAYGVMYYHPNLHDPIGIQFANSSSNITIEEIYEELSTSVSILKFDSTLIIRCFRFSMIRLSQNWLSFIALLIVSSKADSIFFIGFMIKLILLRDVGNLENYYVIYLL